MTEDEEFEALEQRLNMKEQEYEQINHPNGVTTWKTKPKHKEQAMNREDIIKFAREADLICESRPVTAWMESTDLTPYLTRFAALVAAAEREACAKVCDSYALAEGVPGAPTWSEACAAAIRARSNQ